MARHFRNPEGYNKEQIKKWLEEGWQVAEIATQLEVTEGYVYRILQRLNLTTPERARRSLLREFSEKERWFWLRYKPMRYTTTEEKLAFMKEVDLPVLCPIVSIKLDYGLGTKEGKTKENSPTFIKMDGQVRVVSVLGKKLMSYELEQLHNAINFRYENQ